MSPVPTLEDIARLAIIDHHATEAYWDHLESEVESDTLALYDLMSGAAQALRVAIKTYEAAAEEWHNLHTD